MKDAKSPVNDSAGEIPQEKDSAEATCRREDNSEVQIDAAPLSSLMMHCDRVDVERVITRLQKLKMELCGYSSDFSRAARELLEWCSDTQAFDEKLQQPLLSCLKAAYENASRIGFDVGLAYRLLNRYHRGPHTTSTRSIQEVVAAWSEWLAQRLLTEEDQFLKHTSAYTGSKPLMNPQTVPPPQRYTGEPGWSTQIPTSNPQSGVQVVTTVWGMAATHNPAQQSPHTLPGYVEGYGRRPGPAPYFRQGSIPTGEQPMLRQHPGYAGGPGPAPGNPDYQPPPGALSAAAMVAAAATATATATASVFVQQPEHSPGQLGTYPSHLHLGGQPGPQQMTAQQMMHYNGQYSSRMPTSGPSPPSHMMVSREMAMHSAPGPITNNISSSHRHAPYPHPHPSMMQKQYMSGPQNPAKASYSAMQPGHFSPHMELPAGYGPPSPAPRPAVMVNGSGQPISYGASRPPSYYGYQAGVSSRPMTPSGPPMHPSQIAHYQNGYGHSPTMPVSPGAMGPAGTTMHPMYNPAHHHPNMPSHYAMKPMMQPTDTETRLTMPVRDGLILPEFRLEHNLSTSVHPFQLKETINKLLERNDIDLQLKSFHQDDKSKANWPNAVSVVMNGRPLYIERGDRAGDHKPLYLKRFCVPGKNSLTINVTACCCSHLFTLQLVHRPEVRIVLSNIMKKKLLPGDSCISKIKTNFRSNSGSPGHPDPDAPEQTSVKVSLKCPITFRRIELPARSADCQHIPCFDLRPYLELHADRLPWKCPICNKLAPLESLEIDQYMWGILEKLAKTDIDEINIDANASWKPSRTFIKDEDNRSDVCSNGTNNIQLMQVYSPASTTLPSVVKYEAQHNPLSPYPTPPNSHNSQGSNSIAHYNGGVYDAQFNSPPEFTGPMSDRSDGTTVVDDKRLIHRQHSGVESPAAANRTPNYTSQVNNTSPKHGNSQHQIHHQQGPPSNIPYTGPHSQGPPSNAPVYAGGPPSNAPGSVGPPSVAPASVRSPPMPAPSELSTDISDLIAENTEKLPLEGLDDLDLSAYLENSDSSQSTAKPSQGITAEEDELLALFAE